MGGLGAFGKKSNGVFRVQALLAFFLPFARAKRSQ